MSSSRSLKNGSNRQTSIQAMPSLTVPSHGTLQAPGMLPTLMTHQESLNCKPSSSSLSIKSQTTIEILDTHEHKYQQLQRKARDCFKKLLRTNGKLDKQSWAFFYLNNTVAASQGQHFNRISQLRQGMSEFSALWCNFNQPLDRAI